MKKIIILLLVLVTSLTVFSSCKVKNDGSPSDATEVEGAVWYKGADTNVIINDELAMTDDEESVFSVTEFLGLVYSVTEKYPNYSTSSAAGEAKPREIIIGKAERPASENAYKRLSWLLEDDKESRGWLIYSYNGSIAIAYDCELSLKLALDHFENSILLSNMTYKADNGVVKSETFNYADKVAELREAQREEGFAELVSLLGEETVNELKKHYSMIGDDIYIWMANLYDPESGGFYYSNSGRDNMGFGADIESTVQILSHLETGGMFDSKGGTYASGLPEDIKEGLISFARGLQSPVDGYFYHPQWGTDIVASRKGRDLGWSTQMLKAFGVKPLYDAPDGTKGESSLPGTAAPFSLTSFLGNSAVTAVSKVISVSGSSLPECLQSMNAWKIFIDELDVYHNSYYAGNTLAAMHGQITLAGADYVDYLMNYLDSIQNKELGLWADTVDYDSVNGLMKIISSYNYHHRLMPNSDKAMASAMSIALEPDSDYHVCCVYNPWVVMNLVISLTEKYGDKSQADELRELVLSSSAELVRTTYNKLQKYRVDDGGFHYHATLVTNESQQAAVGCAETFESDVNATSICSGGILSNMYMAFGVPEDQRVRLYYSDDAGLFFNELENLGKTIKNDPAPVTSKPFDDYDEKIGDRENGIVNIPTDNSSVNIPDKTINLDGSYKFYSSIVTSDSKPSHEGDLAYNMKNFVYNYEDGTRELASGMYSTAFKIENSYLYGNTYILETDMMVDKSSGGCFAQLFLQGSANTLSINFETFERAVRVTDENGNVTTVNKTFVKISDNYEGADGERDTNIIDTMELGEWFNLRVELYKIYTFVEGSAVKTLDIKAKIFINNEFVGTTEAFKTLVSDPTKYADSAITQAVFALYRFNDCSVWIDNVFVYKSDKEYVHEEVEQDPTDIPESVPTPEGEAADGEYFNNENATGKKYDFETNKKAPSLTNSISGKTWLHKLTDTEGAVKNVMVYFWRTEGGSGTSHEATTHNYNAPTEKPDNMVLIAEMDVAFGGLALNTGYQYMARLYGGGFFAAVYMGTDANGNLKFEGEKNVNPEVSRMKQNTWYNIRYEGYVIDGEKMIIKVFVNNVYALEVEGLDFKSSSSHMFYNQMQYTMQKGSWMLFDNLFVGYDTKEYYAPEISDPDTEGGEEETPPENIPAPEGEATAGEYFNSADSTGSKYDFDSDEKAPELLDGISAETWLHKLTDTEGAVQNAIVYFYRTEGGSGTSHEATIHRFDAPETKPENMVSVVEMDFAIGGLAVNTGYQYLVRIAGGGYVGSVYIGTDSEGALTFVGAKNESSVSSMKQNTWYNIRYECYVINGEKMTVKVFVNGEYALEVDALDFKSSDLCRLQNQLQYTMPAGAWMMYDNLFVGYDSKEYQLPEGVEPAPEVTSPELDGTHEGGEVYNDGESYSGKRYDFTDSTSQSEVINGSDNSAAYDALVHGGKEENGFVYFHRHTEEKISYYLRYNATDAAALEDHVMVIEQDIAFTGLSASSGYSYYITAYLGSSVGKRVQIYLGSNADGKIIFHGGSSIVTLDQDTWYNIRLEIYSDAKVKIYVNGEFAEEIQATVGSASNTSRVLYHIQQAEGDKHGLCIDNLYIGAISKAYTSETEE